MYLLWPKVSQFEQFQCPVSHIFVAPVLVPSQRLQRIKTKRFEKKKLTLQKKSFREKLFFEVPKILIELLLNFV